MASTPARATVLLILIRVVADYPYTVPVSSNYPHSIHAPVLSLCFCCAESNRNRTSFCCSECISHPTKTVHTTIFTAKWQTKWKRTTKYNLKLNILIAALCYLFIINLFFFFCHIVFFAAMSTKSNDFWPPCSFLVYIYLFVFFESMPTKQANIHTFVFDIRKKKLEKRKSNFIRTKL